MSIGPEAGRRHGRVTGWVGAPCDKGGLGLLSDPMGRNKVKPEQALYGAFEVKHIFCTTLHFLHSGFFVRLGIPFSSPRPTHVLRTTRKGTVKVGRRSALAARSV